MMEILPQLTPDSIIFGGLTICLTFALWIVRQQHKDLKDVLKNDHYHFQKYLLENTEAIIEMKNSIRENTEFTKLVCEFLKVLQK